MPTSMDPPPKRARLDVPSSSTNSPFSSNTNTKTPTYQPRLFAPFRALGFITNHIPFALQTRVAKGSLKGPNVNVVSCLGRSWALWDAGKMGLLFVGPETPHPITSLALNNNDVFAASGDKVYRYVRGKVASTYSTSSSKTTLSQILLFNTSLLSLSSSGHSLFIWNIQTEELVSEIEFEKGFVGKVVVHPSTYLNKVVVGGEDGRVQLWNVKTMSLIHSFPAPSASHGPSPSAITLIAQSPAIDVVAIGHASGLIIIFDLRSGETLFTLKMSSYSPASTSSSTSSGQASITGLSFRMEGPPILASSNKEGTIVIWDLEKGGKVLHEMREAHESEIGGLEWVKGQGLLVSSGGDNCIKQWAFDTPLSIPRLLKSRSGHKSPITTLRYYGEDGKQILTAGKDRALRYTSVVRDSRSFELSQGSLAKKANTLSVPVSQLKFTPITSISSSSTRSKDWEDVITAHTDDTHARTWRVGEKKLGRWSFDIQTSGVKAVCVSSCGNFGIIGGGDGSLKMWNMQSGQERKRFNLDGRIDQVDLKVKAGIKPVTNGGKMKGKMMPQSLGKSITGVVSDALNQILVASCLDGGLHFFDFHTTALNAVVKMPANVTALHLNRDSGLLAVVCDDMFIRLVDIETRRIVREMVGFKGRVLDVAFSPDGRWLITTSLDSIIRTFDIPTGQLVDAFKTPSIATSLTFSPTGDFLASAHVDSVGVHLWANRAQFSEIPLRHIDESDVAQATMPSVQGLEGDAEIANITPVGKPEFQDIYTTPDQLESSLVTLSLVPRSRWQTLLNLDIIKQRNKPKEPPKAPVQAPFFLPTTTGGEDGLQTRFDFSSVQEGNGDGKKREDRLDLLSTFVESEFTRRMGEEDVDGDFGSFFEYLKAMNPAAIDLEIRSLLSLQHLELFLRALIGRLKSHRDFEAIQAVLSVFLTIHGDVLMENTELKVVMKEVLKQQEKESERLKELISFTMGTLSFIRQLS